MSARNKGRRTGNKGLFGAGSPAALVLEQRRRGAEVGPGLEDLRIAGGTLDLALARLRYLEDRSRFRQRVHRDLAAQTVRLVGLTEQLDRIRVGAAQVSQGVEHLGYLQAALPPRDAVPNREAADGAPLVFRAGGDGELRPRQERERRLQELLLPEQDDL